MSKSSDIQRAVVDLITEARVMVDRSQKAWCIICTDDESGNVVYVEGIFGEPEQALIKVGESETRDKEQNPGEDFLWSYRVVPFMNKDES